MCSLLLREQDGKVIVDIDVGTSANSSSGPAAIREAIQIALESSLADADLGGHKVDTEPNTLTVTESEQSTILPYILVVVATSLLTENTLEGIQTCIRVMQFDDFIGTRQSKLELSWSDDQWLTLPV